MSQQLEHKPFRENPYFERYVDLLVRLHDAMRGGDEDEAERLREQMDEPGLHLNKDEIQWVKGLSSDLYMFDDDESFRPLDRPRLQLLSDIKAATDRSDGEAVLQLLRRADFVSAEHRAWFRSRAYDTLGYYDLSLRFLSYAASQAPERPEYRYMMLAGLIWLGAIGHVREAALHLLELPDQPPRLRIISAVALCASTEGMSDEEARPLIVQATEVFSSVTAPERQAPLPADEARMAWMVLAEAYSKLGETGNAAKASELSAGSVPASNHLTLVDVTRQSLSLFGAYSQQSVNQFTEKILREDYADAA